MHVYKSSGLPFLKPLDSVLNKLLFRVANNKPVIIIVDGMSGEGKTTLGTHVGDFLQGDLIDLKVQIGQGGEDFMEKLVICHDRGYVVIIYDESGDFDKRAAITKFNMLLNRVFDTYRAYKIIVILCLPNFSFLDNAIFHKGLPRLLLHCCDRNDKEGRYKAFGLRRMMYLKKKMTELTIPLQAYNYVKPNFIGRFLDLPPERSAALARISTASKKNTLSNNVISMRGWLSYDMIAKRSGWSVATVKNYMNSLQIKPVATFKRRAYYDQAAVERLLEEKQK